MNDDGRRLYIHQYSLTSVILEGGPSAAALIVGGLARTAVTKIVHHNVVADGVALGLIDNSLATEIDQRMAETSEGVLTAGLRSLSLRGHRAGRRRGSSLLSPDEVVVASCMDSGYFTFATGREAAVRMYADTCALRPLRGAVNQGRGPDDLHVIKGRSLRFTPSGSIGPHLTLEQAWQGAVRDAERSARSALEPFSRSSSDVAEIVALALDSCRATLSKGFFAWPALQEAC
jgi:hypothetical protein